MPHRPSASDLALGPLPGCAQTQPTWKPRQVPPTPGHDLDSAWGGDAGGQAGEEGGRQATEGVGPLSGSRRAGGAVGGRPAPRALPTPGGGTGSARAVGYMESPGRASHRLQRPGVPPRHPDSRPAAFLAPSWPRVSTGAGRGRGPPRPAPATWAADAPLGQHTRLQPPCVPPSWQKASSWGPGAATEQADWVTVGSRAFPRGEARPPASAGLDGLACTVLPWPRRGVLGDLGARGPIAGCCSAPGALTPPRESRCEARAASCRASSLGMAEPGGALGRGGDRGCPPDRVCGEIAAGTPSVPGRGQWVQGPARRVQSGWGTRPALGPVRGKRVVGLTAAPGGKGKPKRGFFVFCFFKEGVCARESQEWFPARVRCSHSRPANTEGGPWLGPLSPPGGPSSGPSTCFVF